ncbi:hypothetical protein ACHAW5_006431 [Stephanodiscus triporus]|uniref:Peptidylprolyl isomerase n=1 Tax=Stephanodiscus triporus TaxID=2934178 RepID=A0ABD3NDU4_9STRA
MLSSAALIISSAIVLSASSGGIAHGFAPPSSSSSSSFAAPPSSSSSSSSRRRPSPAPRERDDRGGGRRGGPSSPPVPAADDVVVGRDRFLVEAAGRSAGVCLAAAMAFLLTSTSFPLPSGALVKGNAPPPPRRRRDDNDGSGEAGGGEQQQQQQAKCRNVEECQEIAEREETLRSMRDAERASSGPKPRFAPGGTRYLDVLVEADGSGGDDVKATGGEEAAAAVAKSGDVATVHYKVLKIGKRSYDGLSGEDTVVFLHGYGLEDNKRVAGDRDFVFKIGNDRDIRERRMAQKFDQSLIVEVRLVSLS